MNKVTIQKLLNRLSESKISFRFYGDDTIELFGIQSLENISANYLGFYRGNDLTVIDTIVSLGCVLLLKTGEAENLVEKNPNLIFVENPDLALCVVGKLFQEKIEKIIHDSSVIENGAIIGEGSRIGAFSFLGNDVILGENVIIEENVVLKHCTIGSDTHIYPGVKIGSSGLGSHKSKDGRWYHFPHFGRVEIGSNVLIQDNSVIARGSLGNTIIHNGVVLGPLCKIAHNVILHDNTFISQSATIAGSVVIGKNSIIWGNASVRDGIKIGENCIIGMGSVVVRDVSDGTTVYGNPAYLKS